MSVPLFVGRNPESKPFMVSFESCAGTQGAEKVDCVAV